MVLVFVTPPTITLAAGDHDLSGPLMSFPPERRVGIDDASLSVGAILQHCAIPLRFRQPRQHSHRPESSRIEPALHAAELRPARNMLSA